MSNATALELLPTRQTAQPAHRSKDTTAARQTSSSDESHFRHKLSKKIKAITETKKEPEKAQVAAPVKTEPQDKETDGTTPVEDEQPSAELTKSVKKPKAADDLETEAEEVADREAEGKSEKVKLPEVTAAPPVVQAGKKPATVKKPEAKPSNDLAKTAMPQAQQTVAASTKITDSTTVADDDSDGGDAIQPGNSGPYGTGKALIQAHADKSAPAADSADSSDDSSQGTASQTDGVAIDPALTPLAIPETVLADEAGTKPQSASEQTPAGPADVSAISALISGKGSFASALKTASASVATPQAHFVETNQPKIVSGIQGQLMPNGGTMQIRLDPAELGSMQITVHMKDGAMTASFETSSDHATKLLSHSLGQLKSGLESAGMSVEKLHVEQSSKKDFQGDSDSNSNQQPQEQQQQATRDQQRREMVQKMWQKLAGGDPLDMVA